MRWTGRIFFPLDRGRKNVPGKIYVVGYVLIVLFANGQAEARSRCFDQSSWYNTCVSEFAAWECRSIQNQKDHTACYRNAGKRLFAEGTPLRSFELVSTQAMPSGIIFTTYKIGVPSKTE